MASEKQRYYENQAKKGNISASQAQTMGAKYKANAQDVYSSGNLKTSMSGGVPKPNLNDPFGYAAQLKQQYQVPQLEKAASKASKNINDFQAQTSKLIHNIEKQPLALPVMGRQEAVTSAQRSEQATALGNELAAINQRLGYAQDQYKSDLGFYTGQQTFQQNKLESDRNYALAKEKAAAAANPFAALGINLGTTGVSGAGITPVVGEIGQTVPQPTQAADMSQNGAGANYGIPNMGVNGAGITGGGTIQQQQHIQQATQPTVGVAGQPAPGFAPPGQESATGQPPMTTFQPGVNVPLLQQLPTPIASQVKAISEYRQAPVARTSKEGAALMQLVETYNPSYDATQFATKQNLRKSVTSGNLGITINSANTLISHMDALKKSFDTLGNTDYPWYNVVSNKAAVAAGRTDVQKAMTAVQTQISAVASEMGKVYKGTGASPTEKEIEEWRNSFNENMSPTQFKAAVDAGIELMVGKLDAVQNQYEQGMGEPRDFRILSDNSLNLLRNIAPDVYSEYNLDSYGSPGQQSQTSSNIITSPDGQQIEIID